MKLNVLPPLLITSCVKTSAPFTKLSDTNHRIQLTIDGIYQWLKIYNEIILLGEDKKKKIKSKNLFNDKINIKEYNKIILKSLRCAGIFFIL